LVKRAFGFLAAGNDLPLKRTVPTHKHMYRSIADALMNNPVQSLEKRRPSCVSGIPREEATGTEGVKVGKTANVVRHGGANFVRYKYRVVQVGVLEHILACLWQRLDIRLGIPPHQLTSSHFLSIWEEPFLSLPDLLLTPLWAWL
jgi:hypothetical protein